MFYYYQMAFFFLKLAPMIYKTKDLISCHLKQNFIKCYNIWMHVLLFLWHHCQKNLLFFGFTRQRVSAFSFIKLWNFTMISPNYVCSDFVLKIYELCYFIAIFLVFCIFHRFIRKSSVINMDKVKLYLYEIFLIASNASKLLCTFTYHCMLIQKSFTNIAYKR